MYGDSPALPATTHDLQLCAWSARVQDILGEVDAREALAAAAMPSKVLYFGWAELASPSGLTEVQEAFVNYWSPKRVIDECQATRKAVLALAGWAEDTHEGRHQQLVDQLLNLRASGEG